MEEIVQAITGGAETFTPAVLVGVIVFCIIFDGFCSMISSFIGGLRK